MSKKKFHDTNLMWGGRFSSPQDNIMEAINSSIEVDHRMVIQDIEGSIAHVKMLKFQKIISTKICNNIIKGLKVIQDEVINGKFIYDRKFEDIHMNVEKKLYDIIGDDAGYLHIARSRNDQVVTDFKMWVRDSIQDLVSKISENMKTFLTIADNNSNALMPGFTHLQTAQPVTFGHHILAYVEMFDRDKKRFIEAKNRLNECPLGSAALAGTSYPIDRFFTSEKLGFDKPTSNSIDAVSDRDFVLDFLIPAVSKKTIGIPSKLYLSSIMSLVVPDILEVIATFLFANLFIKVDLPELGLPTIDTINPDLRDSENLKPFFSFIRSFSKQNIDSVIFFIMSVSSTSS